MEVILGTTRNSTLWGKQRDWGSAYEKTDVYPGSQSGGPQLSRAGWWGGSGQAQAAL